VLTPFFDEQQENEDKSRPGTNPGMMGNEEKHRICQGRNVKNVDCQPMAEVLRRPGVSAH
jgi:hypothetical protein